MVAVFVTEPGVVSCKTSVTAAVAPFARSPRSHCTTGIEPQVPVLDVTETNVAPAVYISLSVAPET